MSFAVNFLFRKNKDIGLIQPLIKDYDSENIQNFTFLRKLCYF